MVVTEITTLLNEWILNVLFPSTVITIVNEANMYIFLCTGILLTLLQFFYCIVMVKYRLGFSYVSRSYEEKHFFITNFKTLQIALFLSFIVFSTTSILFFVKPGINLYLFPLAVTGLFLLLRVSYRWEVFECTKFDKI